MTGDESYKILVPYAVAPRQTLTTALGEEIARLAHDGRGEYRYLSLPVVCR